MLIPAGTHHCRSCYHTPWPTNTAELGRIHAEPLVEVARLSSLDSMHGCGQETHRLPGLYDHRIIWCGQVLCCGKISEIDMSHRGGTTFSLFFVFHFSLSPFPFLSYNHFL